MPEESTINKLDTVLNYLLNIEHFPYMVAVKINEGLPEFKIGELTEILNYLTDEGFVTRHITHSNVHMWASAFKGRVVMQTGGFKAKFSSDSYASDLHQHEIDRVKNVDVLNDRNQKRLNKLTHHLVVATWFAFGAAILVLIWQIVIWYFPHFSDYPYVWIWETIPKRKI